MSRVLFNDGWTVGPFVSPFDELSGGASKAQAVTLPHDAMRTLARDPAAPAGASGGYFPGGAVTYRKTFTAPQEWRSAVVELEFGGVYRDAMIYLNGVLIGQRPNGYVPFRVRLDDAIRYGSPNQIRVDARAHQDSRWYSGLGIHRDVHLHVLPVTHLSPNGIHITTPDIDDDLAVVGIAVDITNDARSTETRRVRSTLSDATGIVVAREWSTVTLRGHSAETVRQRLLVPSPQRWSVEHPHLYEATIELFDGEDVRDTVTLRFGVRHLQLDPIHGLRINGETVLLRGACIHHDNGILGAVSVPDAELRRVRILKDAGFNAIRSAHNPASAALLDACDQVGMLVIDEAFDMWTEGKKPFDYSLAFTDWWERDIEAMVQQDRNHPSVILYSIGNEILDAGKPLGAQLGRRIAEKVRTLDPTRFLTNGISGFVATLTDIIPAIQAELADRTGGVNDIEGSDKEIIDRVNRSELVTNAIEESHGIVDVAGHNYSLWRYESEHERYPNRIVVGTETHPKDIAANWDVVKRLPYVIGDFTWTGWDYIGEAGLGVTSYSSDGAGWTGADYPALLAFCGDIDITGWRRPASYYRQIAFGLRAEPYIAVHRPRPEKRTPSSLDWAWSDSISSWTWDVPLGELMTVDVYSDADEVALFLNGNPLGVRPISREFVASFVVPYAPGELQAVAWRRGQPAQHSVLRSAGPISALQAAVESKQPPSVSDGLEFVTITVTDADGLPVTRDVDLSAGTTGDIELIGLASGRPVTLSSLSGSACTTYDGRAQAILRRTGPGDGILEVSSPSHPGLRVRLSL